MTAKDLKNALLQEAVQGKLVPQIASEGNARDLLEEIRKEKSKLIKEGKLKKEKPIPGLTEEEIPFDIPENWCWCRFGDIFQHNTGKTQNSSVETKNGTLCKFITTSNLYWNEFDFTKVKEMLFSENELQRCTVTKGDLLICEGGEYGRAAIWNYDYDVCFQNHVHRAREIKQNTLYIEFYYYLIFLYKNIGLIEGRGVGIKSLSTDNLHQIIIPLPPLAEQKRIVAAIEKFMPLIEEYGKKETELKAFNEQIGTLTKKAILQEAVQGKLVPQIAAEGNAKDLLEEIRKEKLSHGFANSYGICDGKDKKNKKSDLRSKSQISVTKKELPEITEDEIPFDIPENWCWCRWGDLSESIQYGYNAPAKETGRIKMVRISDIHENKVFWDSVPYCDISEDEIQTYILKKNDILFARTGGTVGKSFLVQDVPCEAIYAGYLIRTHYNSEKLVPQYLKFFMESNLYWEQLKEGTIATAQPNCNGKTLSKMLIPLPPLAEQKRIVAAIEKMLPLCEKLGR